MARERITRRDAVVAGQGRRGTLVHFQPSPAAMDAVSHMLFGRVLIAVDARRRLGPGAVGACVLGAIAPDADVVLMPMAWDVYLRAHVAGTHSVVGTVACAVAAAGVMRLVRAKARFPALFAAAWAGSLSHLFWDLASGGSVRVGWPVFDTLVSAPLVTMGDPYLLVVVILSTLAIWRWRPSQSRIAAVTLFLLAGLLCVKLVSRHHAVTRYVEMPQADQDRVVASAVEARWGSLLEWDIFDRTDQALRAWRVDRTGRVTPRFAYAVPPETPLVDASRRLDTVQNFLGGHMLAFAVEQRRQAAQDRVLWSDIRYCWPDRDADLTGPPRGDAAAHERWPPPAPLGAGGGRLRCGIWFGGTFDERGRPQAQIVLIGGVVQSRRARGPD